MSTLRVIRARCGVHSIMALLGLRMDSGAGLTPWTRARMPSSAGRLGVPITIRHVGGASGAFQRHRKEHIRADAAGDAACVPCALAGAQAAAFDYAVWSHLVRKRLRSGTVGAEMKGRRVE